jgi:hypothetical protein
MPIRFRCPHCSRLLGIARRKAGTTIACPQCGVSVDVPRPATDAAPGELDEIDELLGHAVGSNGVPGPEPAAPVATPPPKPRAEPARPKAVAAPKPPPPKPVRQKKPGDSLFETGDVDELLGLPADLPPAEEDAAPKPARKGGPKPVTGMDVNSLDAADGTWVLSPQKAALIVVGVVVLLLVAFGMGFLIASLL